jgi:ribosomal peptide maturation radical SAM protein 1
MGREFHRKFPFVDFVCSGEADSSLPRLAKHLGASARNSPPDIPGVVYRQGGRTIATADASVDDLDVLPFPDYSDYFAALRTHRAALASFPCIQVEMSRGCAWAVKGPCRFCGLNGGTRTFREKSPERFLSELRSLASLWPAGYIGLADNAVPSSFFSHVLPELAERPLPAPLFVELRPDVTRSDMALLADARVSIQPGVESLSDHVLRLMHKGTRGLENLRLLKWAASEGVKVHWNLLYGFPGETELDYEETRTLLPAIQHFQPPASCAALRLDRFSRYFEDPEGYGFSAVRPGAAYRHIYPFGEKALRRVAYSFDYDYGPGVERPPTDELRRQVIAWQKGHLHGELRAFDAAGATMWLLDTRPGSAVRRVRLDSLDAALYRACEDICSRSEAGRRVRVELGEFAALEDEIDRRLSSFVERRLMANAGERFLSLALTGRPAGLPGA